ncbi:MAG: sigma-54 dependent transcriptional regulator [Desulfosalsimonadaceae bacterium]
MSRLLIIDDDKTLCESINYHFSKMGWAVHVAHRGDDAIRICSNKKIDVVLLDQRLHDEKGVNLCAPILSHNDQTKIIFITAYPNFDNAVEAIRMGAYDYLAKPFKLEILELAVSKAIKALNLEKVNQVQQYNKKKECRETHLIGSHKGLKNIQTLIDLAASSDAPVLVTGETGTGKSLIAHNIHCKGPKKDESFISANCAAFPENLIEAELFGHEKGAFTGATNAKKGIFEMAEGGTLFLDEIGEIPVHLQSKFLGVMDDNRIRRIGGENLRHVDVRIIAATNIDLEEAVTRKQFRKDLYYRLGVIRIHIPPLRERIEDISDLCDFFLQQLDASGNIELAPGEPEKLMSYDWPGNIRELRNVLERSFILRKGNRIEPSQLLAGGCLSTSASRNADDAFSCKKMIAGLEAEEISSLETVEKLYIQYVLTQKNRNFSATAKCLNISRSTLLRKLKSYNIY